MPFKDIEKRRESMRKWRRNHPEEHRAEVKHWAQTHPEWRRRIVRKSQLKRTKELKEKAYIYYGGNPPKCACCGESNFKFLTIDHINNDGSKMRKIHGVGYKFLKWLERMNYPDGFQVLCMNCNWGKFQNNGVCPHVRN